MRRYLHSKTTSNLPSHLRGTEAALLASWSFLSKGTLLPQSSNVVLLEADAAL